jgi:hypothetical protein
MSQSALSDARSGVVYLEQDLALQGGREHPELGSLLETLRGIRWALDLALETGAPHQEELAAAEQATALRWLQEYVSSVYPRPRYMDALVGQLDLIAHQLEVRSPAVARFDPSIY